MLEAVLEIILKRKMMLKAREMQQYNQDDDAAVSQLYPLGCQYTSLHKSFCPQLLPKKYWIFLIQS